MLTNLLAKLIGLQKLIDAIDGKKAYLGGACEMLGGAATIFAAVSKLGLEVIACKSAADYAAFAHGLKSDPWVLALPMGWTAISHGLGVIGLRHAQAKAAAQP